MPSKAAQSARSAPPPAGALKKADHVFLVDGSSYIFRAYHALPPLNRKSDGLQVNAVLGFCNMLWKLLRDMKPEERPTHLAVIFDKSEHTFRNEFYPAYKARRTTSCRSSNISARRFAPSTFPASSRPGSRPTTSSPPMRARPARPERRPPSCRPTRT